MCGLVGIASLKQSGLNQAHEKAFIDLLIMNSIRGPHSTGIFSVSNKGECKTLKQTGDPFWLINSQEINNVVNYAAQPYPVVFAGHGRWATKGKISVENAHPFRHGNITMMHNGTLTTVPDAKETFEVDSEALCHSIDKRGLAETVSSMRGAYALVYYDETNKTLNFARNLQRPLFLAINTQSDVVMWSSEKEPLEWVRNRHKIHGTFITEEIETNIHYEFQLDKIKPKIFKLPATGEALDKPSKKSHKHHNGQYETFSDYDHEKYYEDFSRRAAAAAVNKAMKQSKKESSNKERSFITVDCFTTKEGNLIQVHKKEEKISFSPYECEIKDEASERYVIIGKRKDTSGEVLFRCGVVGKEILDVFMDEAEISGTIKSICEKEEKGKKTTLVWIQDPRMLQNMSIN